MIKLIRDKSFLIFAVLFVASIIPLACRLIPQDEKPGTPGNELFNPALSHLNTLDKLIGYTDSMYASAYPAAFDTVAYVHALSKVIKQRFYHGVSYYSATENWIAWLAGKLAWRHFSAIVEPDDILKSPKGLCSQQSIIFLEGLRRKGITSRSVGLGYKEGPGHFLTEVYYKNDWHLYDVTIEPKWALSAENKHGSMAFYLNHKDLLASAYQTKIPREIFDKIVKKVSYGQPNDFPAKKMRLFHKATNLATYILPLFFLFLSVRSFRTRTVLKRAQPAKTEHITPALVEEEPVAVLQ